MPIPDGNSTLPSMAECYLVKKFREYVIPQDVYSVGEVARLLHISPDRVRSFAKRDNHPLPIRHFKGGARGSFVLRDELIDWLVTNTISAVDEEMCIRDRLYTVTLRRFLTRHYALSRNSTSASPVSHARRFLLPESD